jgi:hypothetical protein
LKIKILILTSLLISGWAYAQTKVLDSTIVFEKKMSELAEDLYVDALGHLYLINSQNQIKKLKANGDSLAVYNFSKRYGKPSLIDATYPLKTMLYYKEYSTIITVDRLLSVTNVIDLRKFGIFQTNVIASSYDNQFWYYDEQQAQLLKINNQGVTSQQTVDLRQQLTNLPSPTTIIDNDNLVYVYDSAKGVYTFDYYGAYKNFTAFPSCTSFFVYNKTLYGIKDNILYKKKETDATIYSYQLPFNANEAKKIVFEKNKIYCLDKTGITIYNTTL